MNTCSDHNILARDTDCILYQRYLEGLGLDEGVQRKSISMSRRVFSYN